MSKIGQLLKMLALLQTRYMISKNEMAEILETNPRNIKAYIENLREVGIPVEGMTGRHGGYFLGESYHFKPPKLDEAEYSALLLAERILTQKNGFVMEHELQTAIAKIKWAMGDTVGDMRATVPENIMFALGKEDEGEHIKDDIELIYRAISERRRLEILYYTPTKDELKLRIVDPYALVYRDGSWYLVGLCHLREEVLMFKLVRIRRLSMMDDHFRYPYDFSISEYMRNTLNLVRGKEYKVEIQFFHPASVWVSEKVWLPSQKILKLKDGSIIFKARVKGLVDIQNWVMGFGRLAKVLEPEELIENVQKEVEAIKKLYE